MFLYGASGHAKVICEILEECGITIEGIYDDNSSLTQFGKFPFLGVRSKTDKSQRFIISIGNNSVRRKIARTLDAQWGTAISQRANVSTSAIIDEGSVVMQGASINADARIGKHVIINTNSSIDHDCTIGDFAHVSPNAALAGNVSVGEGSHIGIGACVIQGVKVGKWATVGAGTVVIKDVPDYAVVVGNPGKTIKYNTNLK